MSKLTDDKKITPAYLNELIAALNGPGVALITVSPGLNHPSWGGSSKKRKGDEQEENSRISASEHVIEFGWKVELVERLKMLFH